MVVVAARRAVEYEAAAMSMKRVKRASGGSSRDSQAEGQFGFSKPTPPPTWVELTKDKSDASFKPYAMTSTYAKNDLVMHPKFGKGVVTLVEGNRVEILFEDAARKLMHGST
jgi:hypothetical protein